MTAASACLFRSAFSAQMLESTSKAVSAYLDEELSPPEVADSLCSTHWLPILGESWPRDVIPARAARHALEDSVLEVARLAAQARPPPLHNSEAVVGLEWWLQEQSSEDKPKELHTDQALLVVRDGDSISSTSMHPLVSSVLYLSDTGGPTAIFESITSEASPSTVTIALPAMGSLLLFQGDLLHAVLHPPAEPLAIAPSDSAPRRTLLVNFWSRKPPGATDAPLPSLPPASGKQDLRGTAEVVACDIRGSSGTWGNKVGEIDYDTWIVQSETPFAQHAASWKNQIVPESICNLITERALQEQDASSLAFPLLVVHYVNDSDQISDNDKFP